MHPHDGYGQVFSPLPFESHGLLVSHGSHGLFGLQDSELFSAIFKISFLINCGNAPAVYNMKHCSVLTKYNSVYQITASFLAFSLSILVSFLHTMSIMVVKLASPPITFETGSARKTPFAPSPMQ